MSSDQIPSFDFIEQEILNFIFEVGPRKVCTRISKAYDHYDKALHLDGIDEEMGAIRLIAAEEELVVAIFETLKLNEDKMPEHSDFIKKYKNHKVKLAFYPVLSQFRFVFHDMLTNGIVLEGLEDVMSWNVTPVLAENKVLLKISGENGKEIIKCNPLDIGVSWNDGKANDVVEELFKDFAKLIDEQQKMTVREFVTQRADYRNRLLYAEDAGFASMKEDLKTLMPIFKTTFHDLLWCLAIILGSDPSHKKWGLASQFISLYRRVLVESKVIKEVNAG